ncbi:hypothetical protein BC834DRAFT_650355 [Gloeopeniophorella convolvens]|nr:hypothetical protein BC834DRAFT_650355 [Gloeopeniophorella convolvens]
MTGPLRSLSGPQPGQLDYTQPQRVLRHPDARLSFASFHPRTASNVPVYPTEDASSNPKRIVIETRPGGIFNWRFVPRARLAEGVSDEGTWPRVVDILGNAVICDQDQWDIHKLDPFYECFVPALPQLPTIRAKVAAASSFSSTSSSQSSIFADAPYKKRRLSTPPSSIEEEASHSPKKRRHVVHVVDSDSDELEVETIVNASAPRPEPRLFVPGRRVRERYGTARRANRPGATRADHSSTTTRMPPDEHMEGTSPPRTPPRDTARPTSKRRKEEQDVSPVAPNGNSSFKTSKRARTHSPDTLRREASAKLKERVRSRAEEMTRRMHAERDARRAARDQTLMEEIIAEMPEDYQHTQSNSQGETPEQTPEQTPENGQLPDEEQDRLSEALDELRVHEELVAESRRKIADLERDRPLWEAAARDREQREQEEEGQRRATRERRLREEAEARERAERQRREAERARERERQAAAAAEAEAKRRAEAQRARWARGPWTPQRALERYRVLCETFDTAAKPSSLAFEDIPWPTLRAPYTFGPEDIDWAAVEAFFQAMRGHMRLQDYRTFVEKSHRRFHPDRWSARGLLNAVKDETVRGMVEVAANTVAQALTPLWREARNQ